MLGGTLRRDFWKAVMKDAPEGFYYLFYVIFAYSWLTGVYGFFNGFPGNGQHSTPSNGQDWLAFSGVWMIFYYASFAILLSARSSCFKYTHLPADSQFSQ
jgi:hypothetical protein